RVAVHAELCLPAGGVQLPLERHRSLFSKSLAIGFDAVLALAAIGEAFLTRSDGARKDVPCSQSAGPLSYRRRRLAASPVETSTRRISGNSGKPQRRRTVSR